VTRPITRSDIYFYRDLVSVSRNAVIVFRPGSAQRRLAWLDRRGTVLKTVGPVGAIMNVSLSADNREAAFTQKQVETDLLRVWTLDLDRDVVAPLADAAWMPVFTPDGRSILYRNDGSTSEMRRRSLRDHKEESLLAYTFVSPSDVSADGRFVLFTRARNLGDIGVLALAGDRKPEILLDSEHDEREPGFSPDGRWMAYSSSEPGQFEIFVRRFPLTDEKWQVSSGGGLQPIWGHDGRELFYINLDRQLMVVPLSTGTTFTAGTPRVLFQTAVRLNNISHQYAVSADQQRILMVVPVQDIESEVFRVLLDWRPAP